MRYSVTVSMAALITGTLSLILLVSHVPSSTSAGRMSLSAGTRSTSSNVSPSPTKRLPVQILKTHMILPFSYSILYKSAPRKTSAVLTYIFCHFTRFRSKVKHIICRGCGRSRIYTAGQDRRIPRASWVKALGEVLLERALYPHVYRERFEMVQSEEHDTVCDPGPIPLARA